MHKRTKLERIMGIAADIISCWTVENG